MMKEMATHSSILARRSLEGYSLWGRKGSDTTEHSHAKAGDGGWGLRAGRGGVPLEGEPRPSHKCTGTSIQKLL